MTTSETQGEVVRASLSRRPVHGAADLGSARDSRAVFGGSPKTVAKRCNHTEGGQRCERHGRFEPFDGPSNGARRRRALPNPENRALR